MCKPIITKKDLAREVSYNTGYTQKSILEILEEFDNVTEELLSQGYSVKPNNLIRYDNVVMPPRKRYDGRNKIYREEPEKIQIRPKKLKKLLYIVNTLNSVDK